MNDTATTITADTITADTTSDDADLEDIALPARQRRRVLTGVGLGLILVIASAFGVSRSRSSGEEISTPADAPVIGPGALASTVGPPAATLDGLIVQLQTRLEAVPNDAVAWATLGIAYVQQARITADPSYYERSDGAIDRSFEANEDDNFLAFAGRSALASARHDFSNAKEFAEQGLAINDFSPILYGALSDAETQLGNYDAAIDAAQRMVDLSPDPTSLARASYLWELRGDVDMATELMQRVLDDATAPGDRAFALTYLGELAFNAGDPASALDRYNDARTISPDDAPALAGKARAEAALGQIETALDHYRELLDVAPEPSYIAEYGELLESLGRADEAQVQYALFDTVQTLFEANGVRPDSAPTLFYADHGEPERALADAEVGVDARPFLAMHDAHAWALHVNGRHEEALAAVERAGELGYRSALFAYHSGMIKQALGDLDGARADLTLALEINPYFNPLAAPLAAAALGELS